MSRLLPLALVLIAATADRGAPRYLHLEIAGVHGVVWRAHVDEGERFDLSFLHSSERCRWTQRYRAAAAGHIEQIDSIFGCFGAGMPASATEGSPVVRTPDGYLTASRADLGDVPMMAWGPGQITLVLRGRSVPIGSWFADFDPIFVRLR